MRWEKSEPSHSTDEAGEASPKRPRGGKGKVGSSVLEEGKMAETLGSEHISTKRDKLAQLSKQMPNAVLTTLAHHVDLAWLREAYRLTRKDGAAGIDGENAESYEAKLEENLSSLLERFKSGGAIEHRRLSVSTSPKPMGSDCARLGYRRWRTRCCSERC